MSASMENNVMAVDPMNAQPSTWVQYLPHASLVTLAIALANWGRSWARKWENRFRTIENNIQHVEKNAATAASLEATAAQLKDRATIAELTAYQSGIDQKFAEMSSRLERHADQVERRFLQQDQDSADRHSENVRRFDNFSRDTTDRLDKIFLEVARSNGIGRGGARD